MKKLLIALMLTLSSTAFASHEIELNEADSRELYYVLARWGTRATDKEDKVTRIHVRDVRCLFEGRDRKSKGCELYDELYDIERRRSGRAAWALTKLLIEHVGSRCEDPRNGTGYCETAAREIRCWRPWDDKNGPPIRRRYFCEITRIPEARIPEVN